MSAVVCSHTCANCQREARKAARLCVRAKCPNPVEGRKTMCRKHLDENKVYVERARDKSVALEAAS